MPHSPGRFADYLQVIGFVVLISVPGLWAIGTGKPSVPAHENRAPTPCPSLGKLQKPSKFTREFESFFTDYLGFRDWLLECQARWKWDGFGLSPSPDVIVGREGYLFLRQHTRFDAPPRQRPDPRRQLDEWHEVLLKRQQFLAARGVAYLVIFPPEKHAIYPEHLPGEYRYLTEQPLVDEMLRRARASGLNALDLRPVLLREKARNLYQKEDTHWHEQAAIVASEPVFAALRPRFPLLRTPDWGDYEIGTHQPLPMGDLGQQVKPGRPSRELFQAFRLRGTPAQERPLDLGGEQALTLQRIRTLRYVQPQATGPRAVLLHDSFGEALKFFWKESFAQLDCVPTWRWPAEYLERERPQVVIQEIVERKLKLPAKYVLEQGGE